LRSDDILQPGTASATLLAPRPKLKAQIQGQATIEARVEALEKNLISMHERIKEQMAEEVSKITDSLKREEQTRQAEDTTIRETLKTTATGGVHISAIGASWLFLGVILSTASIEIAKLLK
jgi:hypothetical protein